MKKPFWVEIGLLGINSRSAACAWLYSSLAGSLLLIAVTFAALTSVLEITALPALAIGALVGGSFSLSSLWYWLCIKWMDENGGWLK
jgi:hypothetical protein